MKYTLLAFVLLLVSVSDAQVNSLPVIGNKFTFGIDAGASMPASDFASATNSLSSTESSITGSAKTGFYYDVYAGFKFSKLIGIMIQYGSNNNSFNTSNLSVASGASSSASGGYTVAEYLVGPYLSIKLVKIKIEAKLLAGMLTSNYPTLSINSYGTSIVDAFKNGKGFGYCAGAKIKYMLIGGMLGIEVGLNYTGSDVKYSGWSQTINTQGQSPVASSNGSVNMNISLVQATFGLSLDI